MQLSTQLRTSGSISVDRGLVLSTNWIASPTIRRSQLVGISSLAVDLEDRIAIAPPAPKELTPVVVLYGDVSQTARWELQAVDHTV
jgi:hypothetical protein